MTGTPAGDRLSERLGRLGAIGALLTGADRVEIWTPAYAGSPETSDHRLVASVEVATVAGTVTVRVLHAAPLPLTDAHQEGLRLLAHVAGDLEADLFSPRTDAVTELVRAISHDLKTPLTATIGYAELAADQPSVAGDPVAAGYLARCEAGGHRLIRQIDALVEAARRPR